MTRVAFIGGGNMARAIIAGLANANLTVDIAVSEPNARRRAALKREFTQIAVGDSHADAVAAADFVILAHKPQNMDAVAAELAGALANQTVVSILAGVSLETLRAKLRYAKLIRVMPNLAAMVGKGFSVWTASPAASADYNRLDFVEKLLNGVGAHRRVADERLLDAATALSGSGPGYIFAFMDALNASATELGVDSELARAMIVQTFAGAAELAAQSELTFAELVKKVASPGGTTEAALEIFKRADFKATVNAAVNAAFERSRQLRG